MATQLREAVAVFKQSIDACDTIVPEPVKVPPPKPVTVPHPKNGERLSLGELHERLTLAGIPLAKETLNGYACSGKIPFTRVGVHRLFEWKPVILALGRMHRKKKIPHEDIDRVVLAADRPADNGGRESV